MSNASAWLSGKKSTPQYFKDGNLHYATKEEIESFNTK